jgi:lipopolysaccharide transport system ATP-binding protein
MHSIELERLSKRYRISRKGIPLKPRAIGARWRRKRRAQDVWALREVSLRVEAGTILGVIGPNGAGKTTLLKVLARVTLPTEGRALVRGRVASLLGLGAGFHPELTGRENVELNAALHGIPRTLAQRRLDQVVEFAELGDFIDVPVKRYSSGMYLRLGFSVAVNLDPDILLADEVLAVGDVAFQQRCLERIAGLGRSGRTVLLVSHDMGVVADLCNRVVWLSGGRVIEAGEPENVVAHYEEAALSGEASGQRQPAGEQTPYGRLLSMQLLDSDRRPVRDVHVTDEVFARATFRVDLPQTAVRAGVHALTEGITAFRAVAPHRVEVERPGVYAAEARIPPNLLADAIYTIRIEVFMARSGEPPVRLEQPERLTLRVHESDDPSSARGTFKGKLKGVVRPKLEWRLEQEPAEPDRASPHGDRAVLP